MKKIILLLLISLFYQDAESQSLYFPPTTGATWDTISPASLGWCQPQIDTLLDYLELKQSKAFILLKDGKIVIEKYFGAFTQDSVWYWASAGKTLTAFMIGIAQQENLLSIDDTSSKYLTNGWTSCPPNKEDLISIRNQLTMTTGLDDGVPDNHCTIDTCLQYLADAGTRWAYHNAPYTKLDGVITAATGRSMNTYFFQKIGTPTGMNGLFFVSGYDNVFYSKPRSFARFGLLMLAKGNWNGNQILNDTAYFNQMTNTSQNLNKSYGYLTWLNGKSSFMVPGFQIQIPGSFSPHAPADMFAALGKNGQFINVVPSQNLVFIRMGEAGIGDEVPFLINDTIWQKLNAVMCNTVSVIDNEVKNSKLQIHPNPSADYFIIELKDQNFSIEVFDLNGRKILSKQNISSSSKIQTEKLSNGIYTIRVTNTSNKIYHEKIIVSK